MYRKKNTEVIVQIIILIATASLLGYGVLSNKINYYIHPRFRLGIWISIVVLIILAVSLVPKINKARHNANIRRYVIFLVPMCFSLLFPAAESGSIGSMKAKNETYYNTNDNNTNETETTDTGILDQDNIMNETEETEETDDFSSITNVYDKYKKYEENGVLYIKDDIFADWYTDVYDNLPNFIGKKVSYLSQVYSMKDFKENQFLAGRYFMVCCAADLAGYGLICEYDNRSELKDNEWIIVTGTIKKGSYQGADIPILTEVKIEKAEAPKEEYIYYDYY